MESYNLAISGVIDSAFKFHLPKYVQKTPNSISNKQRKEEIAEKERISPPIIFQNTIEKGDQIQKPKRSRTITTGNPDITKFRETKNLFIKWRR